MRLKDYMRAPLHNRLVMSVAHPTRASFWTRCVDVSAP